MNNTILRIAALSMMALTLSACGMTDTTPGGYTPEPIVTGPSGPSGPVGPITNPEPANPQQQYVVQLTASASQNKAEGIKNRFMGDGYNAFVSPLMLGNKLLHRVQIGYFNNENEAKMMLAKMQQHYPGDIYVNDAIVKTP